MINYTAKTLGAVTTVETEEEQIALFLTSDVHFDSPLCNRKVFFEDLDRAVEIGAMIAIAGDLNDLMQGRFDPRRDMSTLRPEYRRSDYYDAVIDDTIAKLAPYAKHILAITPGNHELGVLKNASTFSSDRIVAGLNREHGGRVVHGGYGGWFRIVQKKGKSRTTTRIKYFHGAGGEAPVTRGAIQTNRQAVFLPDADVVWNGHSHNSYHIPITRERLSDRGKQYFHNQHHIRTPGYHMPYGDGSKGWEVTRGGVPKPMGGCLVEIQFEHHSYEDRTKDNLEVHPWLHAPVPVSAVDDLYQGTVFPQE